MPSKFEIDPLLFVKKELSLISNVKIDKKIAAERTKKSDPLIQPKIFINFSLSRWNIIIVHSSLIYVSK